MPYSHISGRQLDTVCKQQGLQNSPIWIAICIATSSINPCRSIFLNQPSLTYWDSFKNINLPVGTHQQMKWPVVIKTKVLLNPPTTPPGRGSAYTSCRLSHTAVQLSSLRSQQFYWRHSAALNIDDGSASLNNLCLKWRIRVNSSPRQHQFNTITTNDCLDKTYAGYQYFWLGSSKVGSPVPAATRAGLGKF